MGIWSSFTEEFARMAAIGDVETMMKLRRRGVSIDAFDDLTGMANPLLKAVQYGQNDVIRLLLSWGADPNAADRNGRTALMIAIAQRNVGAVELLIAQPSLNWGMTARAGICDSRDYAAPCTIMKLARRVNQTEILSKLRDRHSSIQSVPSDQ